MARRKEYPYNPLPQNRTDQPYHADGEWMGDSQLDRVAHYRGEPRTPENEFDALMRCAPGQEPMTSKEELLPLREILADAIDTALDDRERWVFNAIAIERMSVRELAKQLGETKSSTQRTWARARAKLQAHLSGNPYIEEHLEGK